MNLSDLTMIPRMFGEPFYPGFIPVPPNKVNYEGTSALKIYFSKQKPAGEELKFLIEYLIYYVHAPCWKINDEFRKMQQTSFKMQTLQDFENFLIMLLDFGLDPF